MAAVKTTYCSASSTRATRKCSALLSHGALVWGPWTAFFKEAVTERQGWWWGRYMAGGA